MHGEHVAARLMDDQHATRLDGAGLLGRGTTNVSDESKPSGVKIRNCFWLAIVRASSNLKRSISHRARRLQPPITRDAVSGHQRQGDGGGFRRDVLPAWQVRLRKPPPCRPAPFGEGDLSNGAVPIRLECLKGSVAATHVVDAWRSNVILV